MVNLLSLGKGGRVIRYKRTRLVPEVPWGGGRDGGEVTIAPDKREREILASMPGKKKEDPG